MNQNYISSNSNADYSQTHSPEEPQILERSTLTAKSEIGIYDDKIIAQFNSATAYDRKHQLQHYSETSSLQAQDIPRTGSKTPQAYVTVASSNQNYQLDLSGNLTVTLNETTNESDTAYERSFSNNSLSGRRLRSQRQRGKTPTGLRQLTIDDISVNSKMPVSTMDDFANMLLNKQRAAPQQTTTIRATPESNDAPNIMCALDKVSIECSPAQLCESPAKDEPVPEVQYEDIYECQQFMIPTASYEEVTTPTKTTNQYSNNDSEEEEEQTYHQMHQEESHASQVTEVQEPSSMQESPYPSSPRGYNASQSESPEQESPEICQSPSSPNPQVSVKLSTVVTQNLESIQEFNSSLEKSYKIQEYSPSRHIDYTSVNYESTLLDHEREESMSPLMLVQGIGKNIQVHTERNSHGDQSLQLAQDNFVGESPIKLFKIEMEGDSPEMATSVKKAISQQICEDSPVHMTIDNSVLSPTYNHTQYSRAEQAYLKPYQASEPQYKEMALGASPRQFDEDPLDRTLTDVEYSPEKSTGDIFTRQHEHLIAQLQKNHQQEIVKLNGNKKDTIKQLSQKHSAHIEQIQQDHRVELETLCVSLQRATEFSKQQDLELKAKELAAEHGNEQNYLREQELQQLVTQNRHEYELKLSQMMQEHASYLHQSTTEIEGRKNTIISDLEIRLSQFTILAQQAQQENQQLQQALQAKDLLACKFRADNQSMFADLKQLAQAEEHLKQEITDARKLKKDMEQQCYQLKEQLVAQNKQLQEQAKMHTKHMEQLKSQAQMSLQQSASEAERSRKQLQSQEHKFLAARQEIESITEQNIMLTNKAQALDQERVKTIGEKDRKNQELRQMHSELQKMSKAIGGLKQMQQQSQNQSLVSERELYGKNYDRPVQMSASSVLQQPDTNLPEWQKSASNLSLFESMNVRQSQPSPFRKSGHGLTGGNSKSPSPMKGRMDPNMAQYARRQNLNNTHQQDFDALIQDMGLKELKSIKNQMESEYARIPITISGKSLQTRKRKEELEYELDQIEKHISRAQAIR